MGRYALFVWSSYSITLGLMLLNVILASRKFYHTKNSVFVNSFSLNEEGLCNPPFLRGDEQVHKKDNEIEITGSSKNKN